MGSYEIQALLGEGGMGEVYRARDTELGREVAIKVLTASFTNDAQRVKRFEQEARTLAALNHPNIAQIYGLERSDGRTALAMEIVEGSTLAERISHGPIPIPEVLGISNQIADAVEAAHERGIVHRDLKPANVKIKADGMVKVLDFGIAKALDLSTAGGGPDAPTKSGMTEEGAIIGSVGYMSPEQARGMPVDQRTDVWAFGCLLYEMLTGRPAFLAGDTASTLARVLEGSADFDALPAAVPPEVRRALELCLRKDPRRRLRNMGDVRLALEGEFVTSTSLRLPVWRRALPAAAALGLGLGLTAIYLLTLRPPASSTAIAPSPSVTRFAISTAAAPLASLGGLDLAISPDGRRIAYFAQKGDSNHVELYVRELDMLDARPLRGTELVQNGTGNMNPFFSADGKSVGLFVPGRGVIGVPIDGSPPIKLLDSPMRGFIGATWNADGTLIYSSGTLLQRVSGGGGGTPEPLMPERQDRFVASPMPLPGGHAVLFHVFGGGTNRTNRIAVLNLDTHKEETLVEGASNMFYLESGHLVFARGDTLMAVPFKLSELAVTGDAVALVQGIRHPSGGAADYAMSANGTLAYVPANEGTEARRAVVWVDRRGKVIERAVPDLVVNPRSPRLSPDGKRLLLVTGLSGDGDLWSYDLGGQPPVPLALAEDNEWPVWSSDGQQVAFGYGGNSPILLLPADGGLQTPQALEVRGMPQAWSATGELLFEWPLGNPDILATRVGTSGAARKVVASEYAEFSPALSPNGRWLAYVSNRTGEDEIWSQAYPDGVPVRVSRNGGNEPQWSADGSELFYRMGDAMMVASVKPGAQSAFSEPTVLFSGPYVQHAGAGVGRGSYAVARDRFLMILPEDERHAAAAASIVIVENFIEEIKQRMRLSAK
ncbi:MAG TPA: protein kinase [Terriglobia bacterium]|nr:protein kinase [Terriglobia bacterium]